MDNDYTIETITDPNRNVKIGVVTFHASLGLDQWEQFRQELKEMLDNGVKSWVFDLRPITNAYSLDFGMWVTMNATIENHEGKLALKIIKNSQIEKLISITQINQILKIISVEAE